MAPVVPAAPITRTVRLQLDPPASVAPVRLTVRGAVVDAVPPLQVVVAEPSSTVRLTDGNVSETARLVKAVPVGLLIRIVNVLVVTPSAGMVVGRKALVTEILLTGKVVVAAI